MSADWLPTVAALAGVEVPPAPSGTRVYGEARVSDFVAAAAGTAGSGRQYAPRKVPRMFDYRADGYGYCYHQAPRLAIINGTMKLMMNHDGSRLELHNRSAAGEQHSLSNQPYVLEDYLDVLEDTPPPVKPVKGAVVFPHQCPPETTPCWVYADVNMLTRLHDDVAASRPHHPLKRLILQTRTQALLQN